MTLVVGFFIGLNFKSICWSVDMLKVKYGAFGSLAANNYLITDEESGESALIDCSSDKDDMVRFIGDARLKYILLTHGHFDHCDGVHEISVKTGAEIVISEADSKMAADTHANVSSLFGSKWASYTPDLTVNESSSLSLGKHEIKIIAVPGHTPGSVCYLIENHLFTGDTIMVGGVGRTDFPGGSEEELYRSLSRILPMTKTNNVYPGHGEIVLR